MRILVAHSRYRSAAPSGENRVVDEESAALAAAGHDVEIYQRRSDEIDDWSAWDKAMLPLRSVRNRPVHAELRERLTAFAPDVVHVHNTFPMLSPSVLFACRDAGVPVVTTLHNYKLLCASGDFFREGTPCHDCAGGSVAPAIAHGCYRGSRGATAVVAAGTLANRAAWRSLVSAYVFISAAQRDLMAGLDLPTDRVFVKHNFVSAAEPSPDRLHQVVYLGRLDEAKGVRFLMRAWDAFVAQSPEASLRLVVAGGGPLEADLRAWATRHSSVEMVGHLAPEAAHDLLSRSLAAVVPSQWEETFGLVAAEAMACGVAPIAPSRGSFPGLITDGVDGLLFDATDPTSLARVLTRSDSDPQGVVAIGRRAHPTASSRFAMSTNVNELLDIYRFAIDRPRGARPSSASAGLATTDGRHP